ncbi:MAG: LPXTG cell wall anchor domain-containing protein [Peptacetobacter hiranonis]|nr:LPXTG cell wall anchor domain-containing protein [Peptacetobacter hiranonis]
MKFDGEQANNGYQNIEFGYGMQFELVERGSGGGTIIPTPDLDPTPDPEPEDPKDPIPDPKPEDPEDPTPEKPENPEPDKPNQDNPENPGTDKPNKPNQDSPKTGDEAKLMPLIAVMAVSVVGLILLRRKNNN